MQIVCLKIGTFRVHIILSVFVLFKLQRQDGQLFLMEGARIEGKIVWGWKNGQ